MPAAAASARISGPGIATLLTWLFTASLGAFMLRSVIAHGGLRRQRAVRDGLHPGVLVGHFSLALSGLVVWISYLASGWDALAWLAVCLLIPGIGLGICTVTLWTPYPRSPRPASDPLPGPHSAPDHGSQPGGSWLPRLTADGARGRITDALLERALTDAALADELVDEVIASLPAGPPRKRKPRVYPAAVIPFGHGIAAMCTFVLAVVTATTAR